MKSHSERGHARLAPSACERWWQCPGSINASIGIDRASSAYADEGTAAHELAQCCLSSGFDADRFIGQFVNLDMSDPPTKFCEIEAGKRSFPITDEMAESVQEYVDFCRELRNSPEAKRIEFSAEQFVDLSWMGVDGLDGGTADFVAYDTKTLTLDVVDFKYGRGVFVVPCDNKQLLCYALGAARRYSNRGLRCVRLTVVQPRCPSPTGSIRTWECDVLDVFDFEDDLRKRALATRDPEAPLAAGEWCKFCPAAPTCTARAAHVMALAQAEFDALGQLELTPVAGMSNDRLAEVLRHATEIEDWCRSVREYAHNEAIHGRVPTGWKLVAKRATRRWKNECAAMGWLMSNQGLSREDCISETFKSPAQIESLVPGKNKKERAALIEHLTTKESSGTVLAPNEDPRPAVQADANEFDEVHTENMEK